MSERSNSAELAGVFAAMADPTRLRLLNLMSGREVCVCYFVDALRQSQPKISRHLAYLRNAGLVDARREGKWMHYSIHPPANDAVAAILEAALAALRNEPESKDDLLRLNRACCAPQALVVPEPAPRQSGLAPRVQSTQAENA
jgi:ArsR family transcriptional regulator